MRPSTQKRLSAVCLVMTLVATPISLQAGNTSSNIVKSIDYKENLEKDETTRKTELDQAEAEILEPLTSEGPRSEALPAAVVVETTVYYHDTNIAIYDASSTLISDFDHDGFYHRFSVAIDVDTSYSESWVYARLYLSYEGGPWNYYATSSEYEIHGDSELDVFAVETELADGYPPGYYDIRIELYDAEHSDFLLSYGPYDDSSLSALPLEDSVYDDATFSVTHSTEIIVAEHGHGGLGLWFIAALSMIAMLRRLAS